MAESALEKARLEVHRDLRELVAHAAVGMRDAFQDGEYVGAMFKRTRDSIARLEAAAREEERKKMPPPLCGRHDGTLNATGCRGCAIEIAARREGIEEGLRMYAWWKDGTEWVGTCGTTLKDAIVKVRDRLRREAEK